MINSEWGGQMKNLIEDIKNREFRRAYLLCGEEMYLKVQYKKKLQEAVLGSDDTMNLNIYIGKGIDTRAVIEQAETMPFFADHRVILIENSGLFKTANEELAEYLKKVPDETVFIFVEDEVGKRGKMYKAVKSVGRIVEFNRQDEKTLMQWILGILKREKKKITQQTMELFLERTGNDMENISHELEKLLCYTMGREIITQEDVVEITAGQIENKIFEMIRAIGEKRQRDALDFYYDLLALKESPMKILYLLVRQFQALLQVKEMLGNGYDQRQIAAKIGSQSFIVKNYVRQAHFFSKEELEEAIQDCAETEEAVKTGKMKDVLSVEILIVKYSQKKAFD